MKKVRLIRNSICLLVGLAILSGYTTSVKAQEATVYSEEATVYSEEATVYSEGEILNEESFQFIFPDSSRDLITRGTHFMQGRGALANHGGGYLTMSASTNAWGPRDKVYVCAMLQKLTGTGWVTDGIWSKTAYNTDYVGLSLGTSVTTGYSYRLYVDCSVTHGGVTEYGWGVSEAMAVY